MQTIKSLPRNTGTFLTHEFGNGLEHERFVVERYKSMDDGDIRPIEAGRPAKGRRKSRRATASRRSVRQMRPERNEIIICTGIGRGAGGVQYWGEYVVWRHTLYR